DPYDLDLGEDPYDVDLEEWINRRLGPRGHRHCRRCFCASSYKPMSTDGSGPQATSTSLVAAPTRERDQAPEAPTVSARHVSSRFCDALRALQRPRRDDEIMSRAPAPTRTVGASRCRGGTPRECRF